MKTFRIVLGILAVIPLALLMDKLFFRPELYCDNCLGTYAYMVLGVPILIFNIWAWIHPEILEASFLGKKSPASRLGFLLYQSISRT